MPDELKSRFVRALATMIVLFDDVEEEQRKRIRDLERENRALRAEVLSMKQGLERINDERVYP